MTDTKKEIGYQLNPNVGNPKRCSRCRHFSEAELHKCVKHDFTVAFFGCCDDFEREED